VLGGILTGIGGAWMIRNLKEVVKGLKPLHRYDEVSFQNNTSTAQTMNNDSRVQVQQYRGRALMAL
jgi:hypothetical protein